MTKITNPRIKMLVKRTQYQEVIIDESEGYAMPKTLTELFEMCEGIKSDPRSEITKEKWGDSEYEIESFDVSINGNSDE